MYYFSYLEPVCCSISSSNCCFLTCIEVLKRQVRWFAIPISWRISQFAVIHTVKCFSIVSEAEVDVFLKFSWHFYDPVDIGNLISGSSTFSKSSLDIWKFSVHTLLKCRLENFVHYFASVWAECNCVVVWTFFGIAFIWDLNEILFQSFGHCWVFQICWCIDCRTFSASSFRIWKSSAGIPSSPLPLLEWCFLRPTWLCIPGCLALSEWSHHLGYLGHYDLFCRVLLCILATSSNIFCFCQVHTVAVLYCGIFAWNVPLVEQVRSLKTMFAGKKKKKKCPKNGLQSIVLESAKLAPEKS